MYERVLRLDDKEAGLKVFATGSHVVVFDVKGALVQLGRPACGHEKCKAVVVYPRTGNHVRLSVDKLRAALHEGRLVEGLDPAMIEEAWVEHERAWIANSEEGRAMRDAESFVSGELEALMRSHE